MYDMYPEWGPARPDDDRSDGQQPPDAMDRQEHPAERADGN
jgi:hypothetical protein